MDVVFVTSPPIFPALPAILLAKLRRAKLVVDLRDLWPDEVVAVGAASEGSLSIRVLRMIERLMYRSADLVTCTTPAFAETVGERGVGPQKSRLLPNGADLELFRPLPRENDVEAHYEFGDRLVVMYSGLLGIKHGLETVIDAAALLRDREDVVFFIRGEGPRREALEEQARELGLENVVFGGERPIEEVPYLLARADVCVTTLLPDPYLEKIVSVKIFEYLACEKPVVASLRGEGARVVEQSGGGIAIAPGDARAMAGAIRELLDSPERRAEMGKAGRRYVEEHHSRADDRRPARGVARRGDHRPPARAGDGRRVKLVYVTSSLPHGPLEAFLLPEIAALERLGHEVWIVPMWPRGDRVHADAEAFEARTLSEPLVSSAVLASAARELRPAPLARMLRSRPRTVAKNLLVHPKALWLARRLRELRPDHVHAHWISASATLAMVAAERAGIALEPDRAPLGHPRGEPPASKGALGVLRAHDQRGGRAGAAAARRAPRLEPGRAADGRAALRGHGHAARRAASCGC